MREKLLKILKLILPYIAIAVSILVYYKVGDNGKQKQMAHPYYIYFITLIGVLLLIAQIVSIFYSDIRDKVEYKTPFYTGVIVFLLVLNTITTKTTLHPTLYFPSLDRVIGLLVESRAFLFKNVLDSLKLLLTGFLWGGSVGFFTGVALGHSKKVAYWLTPVTKVIGPIPTTAWIPLALSVFATTHSANVFLIAFAVWFPVTLMTSSGIQSIANVNFEVARTLGASTIYQIVHVAIPAAMPSIFLGLFYGTVSSFATLMAVEMNGNSSGIGWYISWQKSVMLYDGVYAGLIIIAAICSLTLTLLFKVRDKVLVWQKGVIKW
ncbi:MAG: ABC transporter permease subunit [Lachnospiraceae bacterium]|nr:ABC transporter permease subunit [Lachnospiraceae bacterium]